MTNPLSVYESRLLSRQETLEQAQIQDDRLANIRLVLFMAMAATLMMSTMDVHLAGLPTWWLLPVPCVAFLWALVVHDKTTKVKVRAAHAVEYTQRGINRLNGLWAGQGVQRDDSVPADHAFCRDLDLFGEGSLFELLCQTRTRAGEEALAQWLIQSTPPDAATLKARQEAVRELQDKLDLREALATDAGDMRAETHPDMLLDWAEAPPHFSKKAMQGLRFWAWSAALLGVMATFAWAMGYGPIPLVVVAAVEWLAARAFRTTLLGIEVGIIKPAEELPILAAAMARLEQERFSSAYLKTLQKKLISEGVGGSTQLRRLGRHVQWLEAQRNQLFAPIGFLLQWSLHFGLRIELWRQAHGVHMREWMDALGELEALCSLANFAYENPSYPMPALRVTHSDAKHQPYFDGVGLAHPLLPSAERISNNVSLNSETPLWIISGSNMSGKSTLLRTVGVNIVLAMMGAPVCAERLELTALAIGATLRVQDDLSSGTSRFYAEIKRLKTILDLAEDRNGQSLFLLDEILSGTNSHDRRLGARALMRSLLELGAIGLVTTHDLALTRHDDDELVRTHSRNLHFEDQFDEGVGQLAFDYTLRDGVVQGSNALPLMRSLGLQV